MATTLRKTLAEESVFRAHCMTAQYIKMLHSRFVVILISIINNDYVKLFLTSRQIGRLFSPSLQKSQQHHKTRHCQHKGMRR